MDIVEKIWLWKTYFTRGHANYFMMILTMFNFIVIQYELFISQFGIFNSIWEFFLLILFTYFPIVSLIGRFDLKHVKGATKVEQNLLKEVSPIYQLIFSNHEYFKEKLEGIEKKLDREKNE